MVDDYMLDMPLDKIKKTIDIEKYDDTKTLIDINDKLPNNITFKNIGILMTHHKR